MSTMYSAIALCVAFLLNLDGTECFHSKTPQDVCGEKEAVKVTSLPSSPTEVFIQHALQPNLYVGIHPSVQTPRFPVIGVAEYPIKFIMMPGRDGAADTRTFMSATEPGLYFCPKYPTSILDNINSPFNLQGFNILTSFKLPYNQFCNGAYSIGSTWEPGRFMRAFSNHSILPNLPVTNTPSEELCFVMWECKEPTCGGPCQNKANWDCYCKCPDNYFGESCQLYGGTLPDEFLPWG